MDDKTEIKLRLLEWILDQHSTTVFDLKKAILFTSLPMLGVAVAFLHSKSPETPINSLGVFYSSGICLIGSVFSTIISYWFLYFSIAFQYDRIDEIDDEEDNDGEDEHGLTKEDRKKIRGFLSTIVFILYALSTLLYLSGVILLSIFFYKNAPS